MDDLALASRVRAELALSDSTSHLEFEVDARQGAVRVRGGVSSMREVTEIRRIAMAVPGVVTLNLDELASPVRA
jgi:osmotically-inducible protein OsmY